MWPDNRLTELFGIEVPVIQAPMAGAGGLDMAAAVSEAGGLGSLACAPLDIQGLDDLMKASARATGRSLNFNFFSHQPPEVNEAKDAAWLGSMSDYFGDVGLPLPKTLSMNGLQPFDEARCRIVEQHAPAVVSFHFGLPSPDLVARVKATGAKLVSSATTVAEALYLESRGCDAVIAQGLEAGGHRGMFLTDDVLSQTGTMALVPQIVDAVDLPVIATGGIADGRGMVAALALGASAVQLGTAFLHAEETTISEAYKAGLRQAGDRQTAVTNVYSGRPTRCLTNRMMLEKGPLTGAAPAFPKGFAITGPLRQQAEAQGSSDFSAHYCGQSAALGKPTTAGQLVRDIAHDARQQMNRFT